MAAALIVGTLVACGGGGSKSATTNSSSSPGSSSAPSSNCIDRVVDFLNSLDVSRIDPSDGLDDTERADLEAQIDAKTKDDPDLASGGACQDELDALPEDQQSSVISRIKPEIALVLGASATQKFSSVGSSIGG
jgi:hypothetical protein